MIIIILAGMAVFFNVAGYLIEKRRRWPILNEQRPTVVYPNALWCT